MVLWRKLLQTNDRGFIIRRMIISQEEKIGDDVLRGFVRAKGIEIVGQHCS
mgnify:FL=1